MSSNFRARKDDFKEKKFAKNKTNETKPSKDSFFIKPTSYKKLDKPKKAFDMKHESKEKPFREKERQINSDQDSESVKITKPFDKKAWRFKRYSRKYKLEQWKEKRKSHLSHEYDKTIKQNKSKQFGDNKETSFQQEDLLSEASNILNSNDDEEGKKIEENIIFPRKKGFHEEIEIADEKKIERLKRKKEKEAAIKEYKKKKLEKFKKLSRKTKKGQPVMKDRIEVLLEEIQNSLKN